MYKLYMCCMIPEVCTRCVVCVALCVACGVSVQVTFSVAAATASDQELGTMLSEAQRKECEAAEEVVSFL